MVKQEFWIHGHSTPEPIVAGEYPGSSIDETSMDLLNSVSYDLDGFQLSSPIMSCASSFENEKLLRLNAGRSVPDSGRWADGYENDTLETISGCKRRIDSLLPPAPNLAKEVSDFPFVDVGQQGLVNVEPDSTSSPITPKLRREADSVDDTDGDFASSVIAKRKQDHNSHTRKSREKLNDKFERLVSILRMAEDDNALKHKAQILEHTLLVLDKLMQENKVLEMELALISRENSVHWVENIVATADNVLDTFHPFVELLCLKEQGIIAELWKVNTSGHYGVLKCTASPNLKERFGNLENELNCLKTTTASDDAQLAFKCFSSMRTCLGGQKDVDSAERRWDCKVWGSLGIPIIYSGRVMLVAVFHNLYKAFDKSFVETGEVVSTCLGNAYSSKNCSGRGASSQQMLRHSSKRAGTLFSSRLSGNLARGSHSTST
mmetsp:Transcript_43522/g.170324  ORF Transcript_43522/g.170324 Transcript_43522/m.170324 type:complete len:434 (-) Transcript_43522:949-2250(-)|eukprot:CAMPEP_0113965402 /NCGR_PEP_ID=MMETSP0011_2-20120614/7722_1 /TAXON_ID=101924 /ORGANISM="Rhodosorus marinus" /LENGTH=433 /DNA_ID=CAMNT_0000977905 /DNA_START=183 /DNA_END=1484 /DNA_ORIENTATION=- /assembly_acc=CAM_ASM_000156